MAENCSASINIEIQENRAEIEAAGQLAQSLINIDIFMLHSLILMNYG